MGAGQNAGARLVGGKAQALGLKLQGHELREAGVHQAVDFYAGRVHGS
jgi:hypothetical protein